MVALAVIAAGLSGFVIVFDARRPWWEPGIVDGRDTRAADGNRRQNIALAVLLVLITVVMSGIFLFWSR